MTGAADAMRARINKANDDLVARNEEIRRRVAAGEQQIAIAREFGISKQRVAAILVPRSSLAAKAREFDAAEAKIRAYDAAVAAGILQPIEDGDGSNDGGAP